MAEKRFLVLIWCLFLLSFVGTLTLFALPYLFWLDWAIASFGLEAKREAIAHRHFTEERFASAQKLALFASAVLAFSLALAWKYRAKAGDWLLIGANDASNLWHEARTAFAETQGLRWWLAFATASLALNSCAAAIFPWHIDEAFSFAFLVGKSPLVAISYYPGPNNHAGYLLFSSILYKLGLPSLWSMRLPAVVFASATQFLAFVWLSRRMDWQVALMAIALFWCCESGFCYAFSGRGYGLLLLLLLLSAIFLGHALRTNNCASWALFVAVSAYGFFTVPTFLYGYVSVWVWKYWESTRHWLRKGFWATSAVLLLTLALYAPILWLNGWKALFANSWVQPLPFYDFLAKAPAQLANIHSASYFFDDWGWLFAVFANLYALFFVKKCQWARAVLVFSLLPIAIVCVQRVWPFARVWHYKALFECVALAMALWQLSRTWEQRWKLPVPIALLLCMVARHFYELSSNYDGYWAREARAWRIYSQYQPKTAYSNSDTYRTFLWKTYTENGNWLIIDDQWADKRYDLILIERNQPFSVPKSVFYSYELVEKDDTVEVWLRK